MQLRWVLVAVFQKRMHRSAVPPPEARSPWRCGDQAIAFTAAVCSQYFNTGCVECWFQTKSWKEKLYLLDSQYSRKIQLMQSLNNQWDNVLLRHPKNKEKKKKGNILYCHSHQMQVCGYHRTTSTHKPIFTHEESRQGKELMWETKRRMYMHTYRHTKK